MQTPPTSSSTGPALTLTPVLLDCPECQHRMCADYNNFRTVTTLDGVVRLTLPIRRCPNPACPRFHRPYRPEAEPHFALPHHEFGLDVIALVGRLRHAEHRSVPEIHRELTRRGVPICARTVTNLLDRYDELLALALADPERLRPAAAAAGPRGPGHRRPAARRRPRGPLGAARLPLRRGAAGQEPAVGDRSEDLAAPARRGAAGPAGADHRRGLRRPGLHPQGGGRRPCPGVPHQLCHFHYLREAARPIYEADRHAKKELKKRVRGVRPIERKVGGRERRRGGGGRPGLLRGGARRA